MAHDHEPPAEAEGSDRLSNRRKFLRQAGMTTAAVAALAGIGDVMGVTPAFASDKDKKFNWAIASLQTGSGKSAKAQDVVEYLNCTCAPNHCPGACHPNGVWCHYCTYSSGGYCVPDGYYCLSGCGTVTLQSTCS